MGNPLIKAVELFDRLMEAETEIERAVRGGEEFLFIDEKLTDEIHCLVLKASVSGEALSRRARIARINLIWRDFLKEQNEREKRNGHASDDGNRAGNGTPQATRNTGKATAGD